MLSRHFGRTRFRVCRSFEIVSFIYRNPRTASDNSQTRAPRTLVSITVAPDLIWVLGQADRSFWGGPDGLRIEPLDETTRVNSGVRQKVSEGVMAGALIRRVDPAYPEIARAMHLAGEVRLRAIIATDGSVEHLEILSGSSILARAAVQAVRQWRYRPTLLNGMPVEVETFITVNFVLGR